jgi:hypothetical protein
MKTCFRCCLIFSLLLTFVFIFTTNSYAEDNNSFSNFESQLGIYAGAKYANRSISNIPVGELIEVKVVDPSKMGSCQKGEIAALINLGNGEWTITKLAGNNGSSVKLIVQNKDGTMKVTKSGTFVHKVLP